jgi:NDP-sugar pyrophosphorylase family protein
MLLAAGRGERMEPLSSLIPKPALEVLGRPLLASALDHLVQAGCSPIVVNLHRHPEAVARAARSAAPPGVELSFSHEPELLGSAGGIGAARHLFGAGPLLAANADVWARLDLAPLLARARPDGAVLGLLPHPDPDRWSAVELGEGGVVRRIVPAGGTTVGTPYLFTGFQILGESVVARLPSAPADIGPVWGALMRRGSLYGVPLEGSWREAGTPGSYRALVSALLAGACWRHPGAQVAGGAEVRGSAVGADCAVADGAVVEDSILTAGARVGEGVQLERCVAAGQMEIAASYCGRDRLILPWGEVALV